jgi:hypothetical protein
MTAVRLAEAWNYILIAAKLAFGELLRLTGAVAGGITNALMFLPDLALKIVGKMIEYLSKGLYSLIDLFSGIANKLNVGGILDGVVGALDKAKYAVEGYGENFGKMLYDVGSDAGKVGNKIASTLQDIGDEAMKTAISNYNAIGKYAKGSDEYAEAFRNWMTGVVDLAGKLKTSLTDVGKGMKEGVHTDDFVRGAKVMEDYEQKMKQAAQSAAIFGEQNKLAETQMGLTKTAINGLLAEGVDPLDARVQKLIGSFNQFRETARSFPELEPGITAFMDTVGFKFDTLSGQFAFAQTAGQQFGTTVGNAFNTLSSGVAGAFTNMLFHAAKFSDAMKQVGKQIVGMFIQMITEIIFRLTIGYGIQKLMNFLFAKSLIASQAGVAFGTAYAPLAAVPPAAAAAGAAAAAAVQTTGTSIAAAGQALDVGGMVLGPAGSPQPIIAHGGEMVLNPEQQEAVFKGDGGIGGRILNVTIHAMDARSFYDMMQGSDAQRALVQVIEDGGPVARAIQSSLRA